jgi:hypothetical protein
MNITHDFDPVYEYTEFNKQKALILLKECLYFINNVPNRTYEAFPYNDSYELASEISKFLEQLTTTYETTGKEG